MLCAPIFCCFSLQPRVKNPADLFPEDPEQKFYKFYTIPNKKVDDQGKKLTTSPPPPLVEGSETNEPDEGKLHRMKVPHLSKKWPFYTSMSWESEGIHYLNREERLKEYFRGMLHAPSLLLTCPCTYFVSQHVSTIFLSFLS